MNTRGYASAGMPVPDPYPRVRVGYGSYGSGGVYPFLPEKNAIFHDVRGISNVSFLPF